MEKKGRKKKKEKKKGEFVGNDGTMLHLGFWPNLFGCYFLE